MILSSFSQVLRSSCVQHIKLAKISKPVQVLTILFFAFVCVLNADISIQAATFTVTKTADTDDGNCDADCSLREAVAAANAATSDDVIGFDWEVFNSPQIINLNMGILSINNFGLLTINGPGAFFLTIDSIEAERHFNILGNAVVTINRITMSGNRNRGSGFGGGIDNFFGTLTLNESVLVNNSAQHGGSIRNGHGRITITNSTISSNSTSAGGGGILNSGDLLEITNSTITDNTAVHNGGAIHNTNGGSVKLKNVTIANNSVSSGSGGGVDNSAGALTVIAHNSIIADNTASSAPDFNGTLTSEGYNLIENTAGGNITGVITGNILGTDPQLLPLYYYGGFTRTFALKVTSPAVDAGDPNDFPTMDQRGVSRPIDGDGDGILRADIGAFELRSAVVSNTNDGGVGSLRQALIDAAATDGVLIFNSGVFGSAQTITLTSGELVIPTGANFSLFGTGADQLTISGNNQSRVLFLNPGANVTISGITITGGNGIGAVKSGFGGGILNNGGRLTIENSVIRNNTAQSGNGGGIRNDVNGILTLNSSTVRNNSASGDGGGIMNISNGIVILDKSTVNTNSASSGGGLFNFGLASLHNSTVSGNSANLFGGGILNTGLFGGVLHLDTITIANNSAVNYGGGVSNESGMVNAANTIIGNNSVNSNNSPDFKGTLASQGFNLIENPAGTIITGTPTGNITGVDPQLMPLGNYGGATETHALRATSPAIDQGSSFGIAGDQRGLPRPFDFPNVPDTADGSDIGAFERQITDPGGQAQFDFDGDGRTDVSIFRPSAGEWWYLRSSDGGNRAFQFGASSDRIVPADYTGDGKSDLAIFRPSTGEWFVLRSEDNSFYSFPFGTNEDIPTPADFDGDGTDDPAVFRPSTGTWYIINSSDNSTTITQFGADGDLPVAADYDGDNKADIAIFRPSDGSWWLNRSTAGGFVTNFGTSSDKTVQADYTGDGKTDVAIWRPSTGEWFILRSEDSSFYSVPFGASGDIPAPGDYDGDGAADYAVFRPSNATWYVQQSTNGFAAVGFGATGDQPVPNAFVR